MDSFRKEKNLKFISQHNNCITNKFHFLRCEKKRALEKYPIPFEYRDCNEEREKKKKRKKNINVGSIGRFEEEKG